MAIISENGNGQLYLRITCDGCEQPITRYQSAIVVYTDPPTGGAADLTKVFHAHKRDYCQNKVRRIAKCRSGYDLWDELGNHLVMLLASVGMKPENVSDTYDHLQARELV
jgi:hypothetical protein